MSSSRPDHPEPGDRRRRDQHTRPLPVNTMNVDVVGENGKAWRTVRHHALDGKERHQKVNVPADETLLYNAHRRKAGRLHRTLCPLWPDRQPQRLRLPLQQPLRGKPADCRSQTRFQASTYVWCAARTFHLPMVKCR